MGLWFSPLGTWPSSSAERVTLACVFSTAFLIVLPTCESWASGRMCQRCVHGHTPCAQSCLLLRHESKEGISFQSERHTGNREGTLPPPRCSGACHLVTAETAEPPDPQAPRPPVSAPAEFPRSHSLPQKPQELPKPHQEPILIVPHGCRGEGDNTKRNEFILVYSQD